MRISFLLLPLLLAAAPATQPTTYPTTRPGHDREPWVFRCVLDGNARTVVVSLGEHRWVAYDASACAVAKVWVGDIELTGPVYDYKHGPQPHARGGILLNRKAPIGLLSQIITGLSTNLGQQSAGAPATMPAGDADKVQKAFNFTYRGYSLKGDAVTFHYEQGATRVDETPGLRANGENTTFLRTVEVSTKGINPKEVGTIELELPTSDSVGSIRIVEGTVNLRDGERLLPITAPAEIPYSTNENQSVLISEPGRIVIETDLKSPTDIRAR